MPRSAEFVKRVTPAGFTFLTHPAFEGLAHPDTIGTLPFFILSFVANLIIELGTRIKNDKEVTIKKFRAF